MNSVIELPFHRLIGLQTLKFIDTERPCALQLTILLVVTIIVDVVLMLGYA